ncbi:MAG: type VI secretion system-associated FHA domain protein [Candidatus Aenigmatarchaeota archaeon]
MSEDLAKNNADKKQKGSVKKVLLCDFLSKSYAVDPKNTLIYIAKKTLNGFQFLSPDPVKPPITREYISSLGDGIYRLDIRNKKDGKPVFPNQVFVRVSDNTVREITDSSEVEIEKNSHPIQLITIPQEALNQLLSRPQLDLTPLLEAMKESYKLISKFQSEMMLETMKMQKEILVQMLKPEEELEEEVEEEVNILDAISNGKWEIVQDIFADIFGEEQGKKLTKILKFAEAYSQAKKIEQLEEQNGTEGN